MGTVLDEVPVDIFGEVFAIMAAKEDWNTLTACTLVGRTWRTLAQPHLFNTIVVHALTDFNKFLEFVDSNPTLASGIHSLTLASAVRSDFTSPTLDCVRFAFVLPKLTHLRKLFLYDLTLQVPNNDMMDICIKLPDHTQEEFDQVSPHATRQILDAAPTRRLDALELDSVDTNHDDMPVIPTVLGMLSLASVGLLRLDNLRDPVDDQVLDYRVGVPRTTVDVCHLSVVAPEGEASAAYLSFYERLIPPGSLRFLATHCLGWASARQLCSFLRARGDNIVTIDLDITELLEIEHNSRGESSPRAVLHALSSCLTPCLLQLTMASQEHAGEVSPRASSPVGTCPRSGSTFPTPESGRRPPPPRCSPPSPHCPSRSTSGSSPSGSSCRKTGPRSSRGWAERCGTCLRSTARCTRGTSSRTSSW